MVSIHYFQNYSSQCFYISHAYSAPRKISGEHIVAALSVRQSVSPIRVRPITLLFEVGFRKTISQKWSPYWDDVLHATFELLPWRSRSKHDLVAKSCPANNFVTSEVRFWKYFTEMITILRWCVGRNIWVATLKVKVTAWHCSKIVSGQ